MTDEQKLKAEGAEKDKRIAELEGQLAAAQSKAPAKEAEVEEDLTPTPTQAEIDKIKLGEQIEAGKAGAYKTRQAKVA